MLTMRKIETWNNLSRQTNDDSRLEIVYDKDNSKEGIPVKMGMPVPRELEYRLQEKIMNGIEKKLVGGIPERSLKRVPKKTVEGIEETVMEGIQEAIDEGIHLGIEEGILIGNEKMKIELERQQLEIAIEMKNTGVSIEDISKITKLSSECIEKLEK